MATSAADRLVAGVTWARPLVLSALIVLGPALMARQLVRASSRGRPLRLRARGYDPLAARRAGGRDLHQGPELFRTRRVSAPVRREYQRDRAGPDPGSVRASRGGAAHRVPLRARQA